MIFHLPFKRTSKRMESFHEEFETRKITQKFSDGKTKEFIKYQKNYDVFHKD